MSPPLDIFGPFKNAVKVLWCSKFKSWSICFKAKLATNVARANRVLSLADSPTTPLVSPGCFCYCRLSSGKFYLLVIHSKSLFVICFYFNFCLVYRVSLFFRKSTYFSDSFLFSMKTSLPCRISPAS